MDDARVTPLGPVTGGLDAAQLDLRGDMDPESFRRAAHLVVDLMADYIERIESHPVLPRMEPGEVVAQLPVDPPADPEPLATILADYAGIIEPNLTHWQHPGFFAYFPTTACGPGILGEMLMSTVVANAMLWRTSPAASELEAVTVGWLRRALGLPAEFDGLYTDTASTSTLIALAAAREAVAPGSTADGLAALPGTPRLRLYASAEAHSSVDKAAMTLGIGRLGVRRIPTDGEYRMDAGHLERAIAEDRAACWTPFAVVATLGTTSSTSVDPCGAIGAIARREGLWLHVDAAYAGAAALLPECGSHFDGWEEADSIVVNPHKWLFTPLDCSLFLSRRLDVVRAAHSLIPEYLRTVSGTSGRDYSEYTPQLGRRFRALKMWFLLRYFGLEGLRARIREHIRLAQHFLAMVQREPDAEVLAPVPFSTVCFRWHPAYGGVDPDVLNERLLDRVNRTGDVFLSHTRLSGRFALRLAVGNLRTEERHVDRAWELIRVGGRALASTGAA